MSNRVSVRSFVHEPDKAIEALAIAQAEEQQLIARDAAIMVAEAIRDQVNGVTRGIVVEAIRCALGIRVDEKNLSRMHASASRLHQERQQRWRRAYQTRSQSDG